MKTLGTLFHLVRADFLERIRRYSFLVVLALTIWAGYLFVPPRGANYLVLFVGLKRGIYNSSWIGLMFGFIAASHLALLGFYLVKNSVERDRQTRVGQIIATTPISKLVYVLGKWLSNLAVLAVILSVMTVIALVMQLIRAEDMNVNLGALIAPIWLMGMPVLAIVAAMAVFFESVSFLSGSLGNVAYIFIWLAALAIQLSVGIDEATGQAQPYNDLFGYTRQLANIHKQVMTIDPDADLGSGLILFLGGRESSTFVWNGVDWKAGMLQGRMMWAGLALIITLASAIPFDRFDPARRKRRLDRKGLFSRLKDLTEGIPSSDFPDRISTEAGELQEITTSQLTPLSLESRHGRFYGLLVAEFKLMVKGQNLIWYIGAIGLIIACLFSSHNFFMMYVLPAVWLWPVPIWSQMGTRERRFNTEQMVFSVPRPVLRQLPSLWLAGVIFSVTLSSGALVHLARVGEITRLLAWLGGALFAPALALVLGISFGNRRAFETIYPLMWYIGLINHVPVLDYAGATAESLTRGMPLVYLGITVVLLVLAVIGRWHTSSSLRKG